jgi:uncharacterized protein YceH (UPF0502 family)
VDLTLTPVEARVVAALVEKSIATPQYYPLSVNSLMAACNQKNGRNPVMALTEGEVGATLNRLEELRLAKRDDQGSRVPKWRHRFNHEMMLKDGPQAVLVALMLRGAQTLAEIRANAAGLNGPADILGVQDALKDLADRAQPLVAEYGRQVGQSATRYGQLLSPTEEAPSGRILEFAAAPAARENAPSVAALEARIAALEERLTALEELLTRP